MKVCPNCYSDNIERTSSTGLRVFFCIILLLIPYGIFVCWVPFVFSHTFRCNVCDKEGKEEELVGMDWREKEVLMGKQKVIENNLKPLIGKWFEYEGFLYKVGKGKGQLMLINATEHNIEPILIGDYSPDTKQIKIKSKLSMDFRIVTIMGAEISLTSFGQEMLSEEEFIAYKSSLSDLRNHIEAKGLLEQQLEIHEDWNK